MFDKPVGELMIEKRVNMRITQKQMALICGISEDLIDTLESGGVTHPTIARRIGEVYGLSEQQIDMLIPENHRKSSPNYDPDKFKSQRDIRRDARKENAK